MDSVVIGVAGISDEFSPNAHHYGHLSGRFPRRVLYEQPASDCGECGDESNQDSHTQFDRHRVVHNVDERCCDQYSTSRPSQRQYVRLPRYGPTPFYAGAVPEIGHDPDPESDREKEALVAEVAPRVADALPNLVAIAAAKFSRKYAEHQAYQLTSPRSKGRHAGWGPMSRLVRARRSISSRRLASARATARPCGVSL